MRRIIGIVALLGAMAAGCATPGGVPMPRADVDAVNQAVPTLGYGVTYAVGNVLLALWGSVIVALMQGS